jgi:hypothetical protein
MPQGVWANIGDAGTVGGCLQQHREPVARERPTL